MPSRAHLNNYLLNGVNSTVLVLAGIVLLSLVILYSSPAYIAVWLLFSLWGFVLLGRFESWWDVFKPCLILWLTVVLFNVVVSTEGQTVLADLSHIPVLGVLRPTYESLVFGVVMGMKLVTIICLCQLYRFWIGADRSFSVLQRFSPRSSLLLSLSVLMLPQLQKRMVEATLALKARGALCQGRSFRMKARAYYILFRVLLAAVLEDSWAKAEALYSRGYGLGRRSSYEAERWKSSDALYAGALLLVLSLSIWRFIQGGGHTRYYPSIVSHDSFIDFWVLALQAVFFTCLLVVTKQSEQRSADSAI